VTGAQFFDHTFGEEFVDDGGNSRAGERTLPGQFGAGDDSCFTQLDEDPAFAGYVLKSSHKSITSRFLLIAFTKI
jgi:hypothetical protein